MDDKHVEKMDPSEGELIELGVATVETRGVTTLLEPEINGAPGEFA